MLRQGADTFVQYPWHGPLTLDSHDALVGFKFVRYVPGVPRFVVPYVFGDSVIEIRLNARNVFLVDNTVRMNPAHYAFDTNGTAVRRSAKGTHSSPGITWKG